MVRRGLLAALAVGACLLVIGLWWAAREDDPPEWVVWHTADLAGEPAWGAPERIGLAVGTGRAGSGCALV